MLPVSKNNWYPSASNAVLKKRAEILSKIRRFFADQQVTEVETPLLCHTAATDPYLHILSLDYQQKTVYLQTSPEYAMKRLLCAGMGSIYQISKAFRGEEAGRWHNPEFTLLEWYIQDFDHHDLMTQVDQLLQYVLQTKPAKKISYQALYQAYLNINPHQASLTTLKTLVNQQAIKTMINHHDLLDKTDYLHLLMTHVIEPQLAELDKTQPIFIYDFPVEQAALAKINAHGAIPVAERFEVYLQGIELANGYHELQDAQAQLARFQADLDKKKILHEKTALALQVGLTDHHLIQALRSGLPACAGVALGIDRLMMIALGVDHIASVMAFDFARA